MAPIPPPIAPPIPVPRPGAINVPIIAPSLAPPIPPPIAPTLSPTAFVLSSAVAISNREEPIARGVATLPKNLPALPNPPRTLLPIPAPFSPFAPSTALAPTPIAESLATLPTFLIPWNHPPEPLPAENASLADFKNPPPAVTPPPVLKVERVPFLIKLDKPPIEPDVASETAIAPKPAPNAYNAGGSAPNLELVSLKMSPISLICEACFSVTASERLAVPSLEFA
ncbi:hypothetical protein [Kochikohdavirus PBEF19]|uniref:Uncharacterized protein n=1 Tax=Enterococcus phage PBEF129 TaxID=2696337 RepID=A0A7T3JEJ5_9CAUD|nr:hypothetical protein [Enterococcus phage PBEF129]